jgi:cell division protein FtsB
MIFYGSNNLIFVSAMKKIILKIWSYLKNLYVLSTLFFIIWILFIDSDRIPKQIKQRAYNDSLLQLKNFYTDGIEGMKTLTEALTKDKEAMEKYGRENYLMKKDNEDVFLIIPPDTVR